MGMALGFLLSVWLILLFASIWICTRPEFDPLKKRGERLSNPSYLYFAAQCEKDTEMQRLYLKLSKFQFRILILGLLALFGAIFF